MWNNIGPDRGVCLLHACCKNFFPYTGALNLDVPIGWQFMMPPAILPRCPASPHSTPRKTLTPAHGACLSSEHFDIWEHAVLLYHGFEWQSAAETFCMLSNQIKGKAEGTLCLLNAAIIFARLDDFASAAQTLEQVLCRAGPQVDLLALIIFIAGHVYLEQGRYERAKAAFNTALSYLEDSQLHYDRYGMRYTLRASSLHRILRTFEMKNNRIDDLGSIGAISVNGVFEAPARPLPSPYVTLAKVYTTPDSSQAFVPMRGSSLPAGSISPVNQNSETSSSERLCCVNQDRHVSSESNILDLATEPCRVDDGLATPKTDTRNSRVIGSLVRSHNVYHPQIIHPPVRARGDVLVPRDARVQGDSTSGLASFIRNLPSRHALQPRSPQLDNVGTRHLVEYLQASGSSNIVHGPALRATVSSHSSSSTSLKPDSIASVDLMETGEHLRQIQSADIVQRGRGQSISPHRSSMDSRFAP